MTDAASIPCLLIREKHSVIPRELGHMGASDLRPQMAPICPVRHWNYWWEWPEERVPAVVAINAFGIHSELTYDLPTPTSHSSSILRASQPGHQSLTMCLIPDRAARSRAHITDDSCLIDLVSASLTL